MTASCRTTTGTGVRTIHGSSMHRVHSYFLFLVILFLAGFLSWQLYAAGSLRDGMDPADMTYTTPNNGRQSTTFLLHIHPYWIFSEDYHLYYLRARRMAAFGAVDDILEPSHSRRYDIRNAAQIFITLLPALLGENIQHYALIYFLYGTLSLCVIFMVSRSVMRNEHLALIGTLLIVYLMDEGRFFRVSTFLFSVPLSVVVLSRTMREDTEGPVLAYAGRDMVLGASLLVLAALDVWAYLFSVSMLGMYAVREVISRNAGYLRSLFMTVLPSVLYLGATVLFYSSRDLSLRAGIGSGAIPNFFLVVTDPWFLAFAAAAVVISVLDRRSIALRPLSSIILGYAGAVLCFGYGMGLSISQLDHFFLLLKPLATWLIIVALARFDWRRLSVSARIASLANRFAIVQQTWAKPAAGLLFCVAMLVAAYYIELPFAHEVRRNSINYANPRKHERLVGYLRSTVRDQRGRSFLTVSPELNYYIAFHSGFDMLLPSGFPLHSLRSNEDIAFRIAGIFRLLGVQPHMGESMLRPGQDQDSWIYNRALAAKGNYLYDLYHRYGLTDRARQGTLEAMAREAAPAGREPLSPDYILVDEVAASLQVRVPEQYRLIYEDHDMRLYQKTDAQRGVVPGREQTQGRENGPGGMAAGPFHVRMTGWMPEGGASGSRSEAIREEAGERNGRSLSPDVGNRLARS